MTTIFYIGLSLPKKSAHGKCCSGSLFVAIEWCEIFLKLLKQFMACFPKGKNVSGYRKKEDIALENIQRTAWYRLNIPLLS